MNTIIKRCVIGATLTLAAVMALAQPPAVVVVGAVGETVIAPDSEFLGTLYYNVESEIASEVDGIVSEVLFEAGMRLNKGDVMARLNNDLLREDLQIAEAALAELEVAFEKAEVDFKRSEKLFAEKSVSEQTLDNDRFAVHTRKRLIEIQKARIAKIKIELEKKEIRAPYSGVVLRKMTDVGAWVGVGDSIAHFALADNIDLIANVPQSIVPFLMIDAEVLATVNKQSHTGKIFAVIPQGDIATRTFPVRIRLDNPEGKLFEGMEAFVRLPTSEEVSCLVVPRDAVLRQPQGTVVFSVENGTATPHPVEIIGYKGDNVGIRAATLKAGMQVVTKGNERLMPGQAVMPRDTLEAQPAEAPASQTPGAGEES